MARAMCCSLSRDMALVLPFGRPKRVASWTFRDSLRENAKDTLIQLQKLLFAGKNPFFQSTAL